MTEKIPFAADEVTIVAAAMQLGDWLRSQQALNESQRRHIRTAQHYLATHTFAAAGESYEFGFVVRAKALVRSWSVCLDAATLEIFSTYSPDPPPEFASPEFWDVVQLEDEFLWRTGEQPHDRSSDVSRWIAETSHPEDYGGAGASCP